MNDLTNLLNPWALLGLFGQALFFGRFFFQWLYSERQGKSVIPIHFWYLSIAGGIIILVYSIHIQDPVFIIGQGLALFIYIRNLILIKKEKTGAGNGPETP